MPAERLRRPALLLFALGLVVWIRLLPLSLAGVESRAAQIATRQAQPQSAAFVDAQLRASERLKDDLRYEAGGRSYPYLGDYDSYLWLRHARRVLETGTACDTVVDGECRDMHTHAPVGVRSRYGRSLHIVAIVALHRAITAVAPDFPLPATAFLVPVLVGALGVLPAFGIGRRLGGDLGGLAAALLVSLNPLFLRRSVGSDNDVWNVVLPLFMVWAALVALEARETRRRVLWAVLAASFAGLHAGTWRGWVFTYGVLLCGLVATTLLALAVARRDRRRTLVRTATVTIAFYVAAGFLTTIAGSEQSYLRLPASLISPLLPKAAPPAPQSPAWPNTFQTVAELSKPNLASVTAEMGGRLTFFISWLGLLVLLLPTSRWKWWHFFVLIAGNYLYRYLLTTAGIGRPALLALVSLPLAVAVWLRLFADRGEEADGGELVVAIWFLAALYLSYGGSRFVMLLVAPFGLAFAAGVGRLHLWLDRRLRELRDPLASLARPLLFAALAAVLIAPVRLAHAAARGTLPRINDAWWDSLGFIRDATPSDAIVNSWWDYGYWIQYVAERRVSADGASLGTHIPHWLGRALVAPMERESAGILRMLNCGSDATPEPEGRHGAYGKLSAQGFDRIAAHELIVALASLDGEGARELLASHGVHQDAVADVLASTHCEPPPSYLVLTSALVPIPAWRALGNWDPRRAYAADVAARFTGPDAVAELMSRLGISQDAAESLYRGVEGLGSEDERRQFVSPSRGYLRAGWIACRREAGKDLLCPAGVRIDRQGTVLRTIVFRPQAPRASPLRLERRGGPAGGEQGAPALLIIAGDEGMEEVVLSSPAHPDLAVLIDVPGERVLLGPAYLLRSTFTRLLFLDGRHSRFFTKFDERRTYGGERVTTWRIEWDAFDRDPNRPRR
jgi:asparagine N-glycosylation enzyme membrane subunit Stt3